MTHAYQFLMQYMQTINPMPTSSNRMGAFTKMVEYYDIRIDR